MRCVCTMLVCICVEFTDLFVFCFGGLLFAACVSVQVWGRMEVCVVGKYGESRDGQVVFGLGCTE